MAQTSLERLKAWHAANPERVKEKNKRQVSKRYYDRMRAGKCVCCGEEDARPGKVACQPCQDVKTVKCRERRRQFMAQGLNCRGKPKQKPGPKPRVKYVENMTELCVVS